MNSGWVRKWLSGAFGVLLVGVAWQVLGETGALGDSWPPLLRIVSTMAKQSDTLAQALAITLQRAAAGYVIGLAAAIALATIASIERRTLSAASHMATTLNAIPVIAIGPALVTLLPRGDTPIIVAALSVFFTTFVTVSAGFASVGAAHGDLFAAMGAGRLKRFWRLELPMCVPSLFDAFALAAPAAILGAVIGEWFGAADGIGPLLVSAMQNVEVNLLWAGAASCAVVSIAVYGALATVRVIAQERFT